MIFTKIAPLGERVGPGTFDTVFNQKKYVDMQGSIIANDYVVIDFVKDKYDVIYFEAYYSKLPEEKYHIELEIQHFPFGIDMIDDRRAIEMGIKILEAQKPKVCPSSKHDEEQES